MLGLRGVRLGLVVPGLFAMQVRAIVEAAAQRKRDGGDPRVEIMVPLVGSVMELHLVRDEIDPVVAEASEGVTLDVPIGTMIELPRAALTARRIAESAEFFSFGTNDLTQTTWGFSRDDVEASIFPAYLDKGVFTVSPFESPRPRRRGRVGAHGRRGRAAHPTGHQAGCLRRARRRPGLRALLPRRRASTTCPVHPSGCPWPGWRRAGLPSSPRRGAFRTDRTLCFRPHRWTLCRRLITDCAI